MVTGAVDDQVVSDDRSRIAIEAAAKDAHIVTHPGVGPEREGAARDAHVATDRSVDGRAAPEDGQITVHRAVDSDGAA